MNAIAVDEELDAVVVGGAGVDTNVYLYGDQIDWSVEGNFSRNVDDVGQADDGTTSLRRATRAVPILAS